MKKIITTTVEDWSAVFKRKPTLHKVSDFVAELKKCKLKWTINRKGMKIIYAISNNI
jgi:hypothetical protein